MDYGKWKGGLMLKSTRKILKSGDIIELSYKRDDTDGTRTGEWKITGAEEACEGGSSVCYWAVHDGVQGRLKEFYPLPDRQHFIELSRDAEGQLLPDGSKCRDEFEKLKLDFTRNYEKLEQVKLKNYDSVVLNNYMPGSDILYGYSKCGNARGSVYIWTANDKKGITFEEYIKKISKNPDKNADLKLQKIVGVILTVTDFVKALHYAGFMHLDIKPSNFLIPYNGDMDINENSISAFDINSFKYIYSSLPQEYTGTYGFSAPENERGRGCDLSDLYSIGACLFYAVCQIPSADGITNMRYTGSHSEINDFLKQSYLLQSLKNRRRAQIVARLGGIIGKCLEYNPGKRYTSCKTLEEDLKKLAVELEVYVKNKCIDDDGELVIIEKEKKNDNAKAAISNLLFNEPIYKYCRDKTLNVLVVGTGNYGQMFIDQCLQAGQMYGRRLRITACSANMCVDREIYLSTRPWLSRFVNIDGGEDSEYGELHFTEVSDDGRMFAAGKGTGNRELADEILERAGAPEYVFVALGDETLNAKTAHAFADAMKAPDGKEGLVSFAVQSDKKYVKGNPVYMNRNTAAAAVSPELERMAFNVHMSWSDTRNAEMDKISEEFKRKYNYDSSVSNAMSVRYKLENAGVSGENMTDAAEKFREKITADSALYRGLVAAEHRRWVMEKVCSGWVGVTEENFDDFFDGVLRRGEIKDKKRKIHPCITESTCDTKLQACFYEGGKVRQDMWNGESLSVPQITDPLDRLSVMLHRKFYAEAKRITEARKSPDSFGDMRRLEDLVFSFGDSKGALNKYKLCIKKLLDGDAASAGMLSAYGDDLLGSLPKDSAAAEDAAVCISNIHRELFPVIESCLYRNYKSYDEELIRNVPFICTYKATPNLVMFFDDGGEYGGVNHVIFKNVASATVIKPKQITYIYRLEDEGRIDLFAGKLCNITKYFRARHINCSVRTVVLNTAGEDACARLCAALEGFDIKHTAYLCRSEDEVFSCLSRFLRGEERKKAFTLFDGTNSFSKSPMQCFRFLSLFEGALKKTAYFEFDYRKKRFENCKRCEYLLFAEDRSYLRVDDIFLLMNAYDNRYNYPEYSADYERLWGIYKGDYLTRQDEESRLRNGVKNWSVLCDTIASYPRKKLYFELTDERKKSNVHYTYYFPSFCAAALIKILEFFKEKGAAAQESYITCFTSDTCRLEFFGDYDLKPELEQLLREPYMLADAESVTVEGYLRINAMCITVRFESLSVRSLELRDRFSYYVLQQLEQGGFINCLKKNGDETNVDFVFSSHRIRRLMETAGEILEIYVYYELNGFFDDSASGYEFSRGSDKQELDCIGCKGFETFIIECKSQIKLNQGYYHKLNSIAAQFGINCKKIMIGNTYSHSAEYDEHNAAQIDKGNNMDIITVSKPADIINIRETMKKIEEGTYKG